MTVKQLYDELGQLIKEGHGNTRVIANCEFNITKGNGYYNDFPLCHLNDVYYQSGDIELEFSQEEEFTEEKKYKDDNDGWHDLIADPNDLPKENMIDVWALVKSDDGKMIPYVANYSCYTKKWYPDVDDEEVIEVIYWKEIIPPKE